MGSLTYISNISQLQKRLLCFSPPSACREGSLAAFQLDNLVQLFWCRTWCPPAPISNRSIGFIFSDPFSRGRIAAWLPKCRQPADTPSHSRSRVSYYWCWTF